LELQVLWMRGGKSSSALSLCKVKTQIGTMTRCNDWLRMLIRDWSQLKAFSRPLKPQIHRAAILESGKPRQRKTTAPIILYLLRKLNWFPVLSPVPTWDLFIFRTRTKSLLLTRTSIRAWKWVRPATRLQNQSDRGSICLMSWVRSVILSRFLPQLHHEKMWP